MSKIQIKIDKQKIEKELNKKVNEIVRKEILIQQSREKISMNMLSVNSEIMLKVFLNKYNETKYYTVDGNVSEFPDYMKFCIKDIMEDLKLYGYISYYDNYIGGKWSVTLTPEAIQYFEKKGCREELFDELVDSERELLKEIIKVENNNEDISEYLNKIVDNDKKDIFRGIIESLKRNGLIEVFWTDNTVDDARLTQAGRTYFEREGKHNARLSKLSSNTYNITANNSNFVMGNVVNSTLNIDNSISIIKQEIEEKCDNEEDKKELYELLEETKEIIENMQNSKHIDKRKGYFQKITEHLDKHGWFYAEVVSFLGEATLKMLGDKYIKGV